MIVTKTRDPFATPPAVRLVGHFDHPDFREAIRLLKAGAQLEGGDRPPELVVIAQSRPGAIGEPEVQRMRRAVPLAGLVGLLGSWCEGETRTGRPWPGVVRLYWHEFPTWWRRQLALRAEGRCPDWARLDDLEFRTSVFNVLASVQHSASNMQHRIPVSHGVIVLSTIYRENADALADVFLRAGYSTVWQRRNRPHCTVRGATAGIWDGGQLDAHEAVELARFCRTLARGSAPVLALLDFPRHHAVERARECGASAVLGKPWRNEELIASIESVAQRSGIARVA